MAERVHLIRVALQNALNRVAAGKLRSSRERGKGLYMKVNVEFRRCQTCGRVEKVATSAVIVEGSHSEKCTNEQEKWLVFTAAEDWKPPENGAKLRQVILPTATFSDHITNYAIGFVKLIDEGGVEDAVCAGSGTLVKLGKVHGILTAAHVLEDLPSQGRVGLAKFFGSEVHYRKQTIEMDYSKKLIVRGKGAASDGPDIAFLRLPDKDIGWLEAIQSFYNLGLHQDDSSKDPPAPNSVYCMVGAIDERTKDLPGERPGERRKGFEAIMTDGNIMWERDTENVSLIAIKPKVYPDFTLPNGFGGTSGGGLWQIYFKENDGKTEYSGVRLVGVPFYQSEVGQDGFRTITCHSQKDIYGLLLNTIVENWPEETESEK